MPETIDPMWHEIEIARDGIDTFAGGGSNEMAAFEALMQDRLALYAQLERYKAALESIHVVTTTYADGGRGDRVAVNISPESYDRLRDALSTHQETDQEENR